MSIESVVPSNHLILCCPLLLLPPIFLSIDVGDRWARQLMFVKWSKAGFCLQPDKNNACFLSSIDTEAVNNGGNFLQQNRNEWTVFGTYLSTRPLTKVKQSWLFFNCYYKQILVAGLVLHRANYSLTPYRLYSAPGILFPLHSLVAFCILERRSWANSLRDTRPTCSVAWCQLWPFRNFAGEKIKPDLQEDIKPLPFPEKGGHSSWGVSLRCFLLPGKNNKAILFYFLQTLSPYFNLALVDRDPRFWQQHQGLFQWGCSSHQVAKVLELQLQHHSFQWIFRVDFF